MGEYMDLPPFPDNLFSLREAEFFLEQARAKVYTLALYQHSLQFSADIRTSLLRTRRRFSQWLSAWEHSFTALLSAIIPTLSDLEVCQAMVLKVNHLLFTIIVDVNIGMPEAYDPSSYKLFIPEFEAIVALSKRVLAKYKTPPLPSVQVLDGPFFTYGMWLTFPLFYTRSWAPDETLRAEANRLFEHHLWSAGSVFIFSDQLIECIGCSRTMHSQNGQPTARFLTLYHYPAN